MFLPLIGAMLTGATIGIITMFGLVTWGIAHGDKYSPEAVIVRVTAMHVIMYSVCAATAIIVWG